MRSIITSHCFDWYNARHGHLSGVKAPSEADVRRAGRSRPSSGGGALGSGADLGLRKHVLGASLRLRAASQYID